MWIQINITFIMDWVNSCFAFCPISALDDWICVLSFRCRYHSNLRLPLIYPHPYRQITVETEFDNPLYETAGVSVHYIWNSRFHLPSHCSLPQKHRDYSQRLFHCHQETREYEVSIWEGSRETFLFAPSQLFILFLYRRRSRCKYK